MFIQYQKLIVIHERLQNNKFISNLLDTTSFDVYKERTKSSFELLDSIKGENIYRVYPHKLFCNTKIKNRCLTHDDKDIFYIDEDHPSLKGAEMISDLIIKEIERIELNLTKLICLYYFINIIFIFLIFL